MNRWQREITRVTRPRLAAGQSYDRMSRIYDFIAGPSEARFRRLGLAFLNPQPHETVLEVGAGTGHGVLALAQAVGAGGLVCAVDLSQGMLDIAQNRVREAELSNIRLSRGDAFQLPYANNKFDLVFLCFTLELFDTPDILPVLQQVRRVLRSGGRVGVVSLSKEDTWPVRLYEWGHTRFPNVLDCRPILTRAIVEHAGFTIHQHRIQKMWGLPVDILVGSIKS